ncbi:Co2+/Mg2+ efflux protein ApaG [bacterium]|nr:Co2+/Mg2+ efflux protein ApaG [bacterium]
MASKEVDQEENRPEQGDQQQWMSSTREISVAVEPSFLSEQSDIDRSLFAHLYKITIRNKGEHTVQLINRHWRVVSAGRQIADVKGEGVVGEQPVLQPEEQFQYESWSVVHDPIGSMSGTFTFVDDSGEFFDVEVPEFPLIHMENLTLH